VYNFYDCKDDCFRLVKMGAYHKDFKELKYVSKMKLKQKIQEGKEYDKKSKLNNNAEEINDQPIE